MLLGLIEEYVFGDARGYGRSILYVCEKTKWFRTGQIYVEGLDDIIDGILYSASTGGCSVRSSLQPRQGDINTIPFVTSLSIDIDAETFDVAKKVAKLAYSLLEGLNTTPLVVFTGGKGYALRVYLSKEYREIEEEAYRSLGEMLTEPLPRVANIELPPIKGLIKVPFTRHEKTKQLVLFYDPKKDKHIDELDEAADLLAKAEDKPLPMLKGFEPSKKKAVKAPAVIPAAEERGGGYEYLENLNPTKLTDCRKRLAILWGLYKGGTVEEAIKAAEEFLEKAGAKEKAKQVKYSIRWAVAKGIKPPRKETLLKRKSFIGISYEDCLDMLK